MSTTTELRNVVFKQLTPEYIENITNRLNEKNESVSANKKNKLILKRFEKKKQTNKRFSTGNKLSEIMLKLFPCELFGLAIEEIDENRNTDYVSFIF